MAALTLELDLHQESFLKTMIENDNLDVCVCQQLRNQLKHNGYSSLYKKCKDSVQSNFLIVWDIMNLVYK